jgi:hypothetical protein
MHINQRIRARLISGDQQSLNDFVEKVSAYFSFSYFFRSQYFWMWSRRTNQLVSVLALVYVLGIASSSSKVNISVASKSIRKDLKIRRKLKVLAAYFTEKTRTTTNSLSLWTTFIK